MYNKFYHNERLSSRLLLLLAPQGHQTDGSNLHNLETDTGNITDGVTLATETRDQNLVLENFIRTKDAKQSQ